MYDNEEQKLLIDASILYYLKGKKQSQIARELYLSRPKVSRLLKKARETNIVRISINYHDDELGDLEEDFRQKFDLDKVIIVRTLDDESERIQEVGKIAAEELNEQIQDGMQVGISWGKHVAEAVRYLEPKVLNDAAVVEMFGAVSGSLGNTDKSEIGRMMARKLSSEFYPLHSPMYIRGDVAREEVKHSKVIRRTLDKIEDCNLIVSGIGSPGASGLSPVWRELSRIGLKKEVQESQAAGFMLAHFYDRSGHFIDVEANGCVVGIQRHHIMKEKRIFAIASGCDKADAIYGALQAGMISTLITDEKTARSVMAIQ